MFDILIVTRQRLQRSLCLHETTCSGSKMWWVVVWCPHVFTVDDFTHTWHYGYLFHIPRCVLFVSSVQLSFKMHLSKYQDRTRAIDPLHKTEPYWVWTCFVSGSTLADWYTSCHNKITINFRLIFGAVLLMAYKKLNTILSFF